MTNLGNDLTLEHEPRSISTESVPPNNNYAKMEIQTNGNKLYSYTYDKQNELQTLGPFHENNNDEKTPSLVNAFSNNSKKSLG